MQCLFCVGNLLALWLIPATSRIWVLSRIFIRCLAFSFLRCLWPFPSFFVVWRMSFCAISLKDKDQFPVPSLLKSPYRLFSWGYCVLDFSSKYLQVWVTRHRSCLFRCTIHSEFFIRMEDVFWIRPVIVWLGHCVGLHTYLCVRQFCYVLKYWVIDRIQCCCLWHKCLPEIFVAVLMLFKSPLCVPISGRLFYTWNSLVVSFA